ncbi:hypothetical protein TIFTF001_034658 [Ficus carica]|uniref:Uncharacterized protein n=1 Tax=Ficus carica TaxID=3494 RepID=A0AA88J5G3_FICCA|nr:hypothetical protein TIFTF001_034658 [Ficus carica]
MEHSKKGRARRRNPMDPTVEGKRRATIMKRVHMARKRGERIKVTFDEKGQPEGKHGDELMSWIGMLAREHVPIWIQDWRSQESFRNTCLKSCGEAARNFRYDLYKTFVEEFINEEGVWTRPKKVIDNYANIEEEDWMKFVQYRTSSQFQQLSDRGSEIRTNNEYSSRGGRDGYRKLDQEMFKKTGKWERRDGLWLEQQMGLDGELKNPACKKASELIMEYTTQESQGTFESVGTNDVLSQALSRPEHKGRVRGQSKFVKLSQYFNLSQSSKKDNEVQSMRREIEELTALVRGLCANRDVERSVDPKNVPTVDQHNSFKASCSAQEKQDGVAEPPTMPVDSQKCKLYIFDEVQGGQLLVAFGRVWLESLPTDTVHRIPLGEGNVEKFWQSFGFNSMLKICEPTTPIYRWPAIQGENEPKIRKIFGAIWRARAECLESLGEQAFTLVRPCDASKVSYLPAIPDTRLWKDGAADCEMWDGHHHGFP